MEVTEHRRIAITDASCVGEARRYAVEVARTLGMSESGMGRVGVIVTELATNVMKHGGGGEILTRAIPEQEQRGIVVVAIDQGLGISNLAAAVRDGHSTAGSPGTGLGAVKRLADRFDVHSVPGSGTAVLAAIRGEERSSSMLQSARFHVGAVNVPHPEEDVSGDTWAATHSPSVSRILVADGLGHGVLAAAASREAANIFRQYPGAGSGETVERIHAGLRGTRGAAIAVATVDRGHGSVRYAGIGNIAATICDAEQARSLVSHHGTAGHEARRVQEFTYPWGVRSMLVMHSDGLTSHWDVSRQPGFTERDPDLAAAVLYRDFRRGRDDTTVVVARTEAA